MHDIVVIIRLFKALKRGKNSEVSISVRILSNMAAFASLHMVSMIWHGAGYWLVSEACTQLFFSG